MRALNKACLSAEAQSEKTRALFAEKFKSPINQKDRPNQGF